MISLLDVHGKSFLIHMVVTTTQSWYLCLLFLETQTKGVILTTGCSQRLVGIDLPSHVWIRLHVISSKTKTPSHPLSRMSSMLQTTASQGATTVPKKSNPWFDEECREMLRARGALDRGGGPRAETLMSFRRTHGQALFYSVNKVVVDKICYKA